MGATDPPERATRRDTLWDAGLDLLAGGSCLGCARPGRLWCASCARDLPVHPARREPHPAPAGLPATWSVAAYGGVVRDLIVGHKERHLLALARPLGRLLATAVAAGLGAAEVEGRPGAVLLVPAPSRPSTVRERGHDATRRLVRAAAHELRAAGRPAVEAPVLRVRGAMRDQAGLDREERAANLAGRLWVPSRVLARLARGQHGKQVQVVLCDDVLTTGATLAEGARALASVGLPPLLGATVAATARRRPHVRPHERPDEQATNRTDDGAGLAPAD